MPSEKEFNVALELLTDYVNDIGDSVEGTIDDVVGIGASGVETEGVVCSHGASRYVIVGGSSNKYFSIIYPSFIIQSIASNLDEETVDDLLQEYDEDDLVQEMDDFEVAERIEEDEIPDDLEDEMITGEAHLAAREWLDSLDDELQQEIRFHLMDRLSDSSVAFTVFPESGETVYGFQVARKVFPYEEAFTLQEFNQSVQAVVSVGVDGHNFLAKTFNIREELSSPGEELRSPSLP